MKKSRFTEREVIAILNEHARGARVAVVCRHHGISQPTFYQWKSKYSGMGVSQLKRVKELEAMVAHYKKAVAELMLDIEVLKDLISKNGTGAIDKRRAVAYSTQEHAISIRRACKLLGTHASLILYRPKMKRGVSIERASSSASVDE
jgi:putative transposase